MARQSGDLATARTAFLHRCGGARISRSAPIWHGRSAIVERCRS
jgi:hypothetical protein